MIKQILPFFISKPLQPVYKLMHKIALLGMNYGTIHIEELSGEMQVLKKALHNKHKPIIFDIGAHTGTYSKKILHANKNSEIYAFEPNKSLNFQLKKTKDIHFFNIALSNRNGTSTFYVPIKKKTLASLQKRESWDSNSVTKIDVQTKTLDSFCKQQNISQITFVKIDTEGYEFEVLQGAKDLLRNRKIQYIQFEFGGTDIDSRHFFRDFWNFLSNDYTIYRILPNSIYHIKNYSEDLEIFSANNFLAIMKR